MSFVDGKRAILLNKQLKSIPITFLRNSIAYDQNYNPVPAKVPRFWTVGADSGLIIESTTTNLFSALDSQSVSVNASADGDLGFTVSTSGFIAASANSQFSVSNVTQILNTSTCTSFKLYLQCYDSTNTNLGQVNLTVISNPALGTKIDYSGTGTTLANTTKIKIMGVAYGVKSGCNINLTFNQIENKRYATSWTLGGTTRAAETLILDTSCLNLSEGTVELEFIITSSFKDTSAPSHRIFYTGVSSNANIFSLRNTAGNFGAATSAANTNSSIVAVAASTLSNALHKVAMGWKSTVLDLTIDGVSAGTPVTNPNLPSQKAALIHIGSDDNGTYGSQQADTIIKTVCLSKIYRSISERSARSKLKAYPIDRSVTAYISLESDIRGVAP